MLRRFDRLYDEIEKLLNATLTIGALIAGVLVLNAIAKPAISTALGRSRISDFHLGAVEIVVLGAVAVVMLRAMLRRT
jgi:hypothetical protein